MEEEDQEVATAGATEVIEVAIEATEVVSEVAVEEAAEAEASAAT